MDELKAPLLDDDKIHHHYEKEGKNKNLNQTLDKEHQDHHQSEKIDCLFSKHVSSSAGLRQQKQQQRTAVRIVLHSIIVPVYLIVALYSISCPFLGLYLPVIYFSAIGYAVPAELFLSCTGLIVVVIIATSCKIFSTCGDDSAYKILLVLSAVMTSLAGWKKFQQMISLELEHSRKKNDDDDHDGDFSDITDEKTDGQKEDSLEGYWKALSHQPRQRIVPVAPGPELDKLRQAEERRRQERKQRSSQDDKNFIAAYVGVPIDGKFDAIV